jgi:gliding motility-associated-like protein
LLNSLIALGQTADALKGCVPFKVNFKPPAGSSTYFWDFKDGVTSVLEEPSNVFNQAGVYNVEFRETVAGPVLGTVQITVYPVPVLDIQTQSGCAPLYTTFTSTVNIHPDIDIKNYVWVFGDGHSQMGLPTATHTYTAVGVYDVSFNVETEFLTCNRTVIFQDAVEAIAPPVASFYTTPASTITCDNFLNNVTYHNTSTGVLPMKHIWDMGDGISLETNEPPAQNYLKGVKTTTLTTVYDPHLPGCTTTHTQPVSVGRPSIEIFYSKDTICIGESLIFTTPTVGTYQWFFTPGSVTIDRPADLINDTIIATFTKAGLQQVALRVTSPDGNCYDTKVIFIYVDEVKVEVEIDPVFSCFSPTTYAYTAVSNKLDAIYTWSLGGNIYTGPTASHTYYSSTDTIYYGRNVLELKGGFLSVVSPLTGCSTLALIVSPMHVPNARFAGNRYNGCVPLSVTFSDSSASTNNIVQWEWIFGDGHSEIRNNPSNITHTYTDTGTYQVTLVVTTVDGCIDTSFARMIEVGDRLAGQVDFSTDKNTVCPGEDVLLTALPSPAADAIIDAYHFTAEENRTFHCTDNKDMTWSFNHVVGPQDIKLTVEFNGCYTDVVKQNFITVNGAVAKIDYTALCSDPLNYTFTDQSLGATSLLWDFGDGATGTAATEPHAYAVSGNYTVTLTAEDAGSGCAPTTDIRLVTPRELKADIAGDSLICINQPVVFSGSQSKDVYANCFTGYTWQFPTNPQMRPYTYSSSQGEFTFANAGDHIVRLIVKDVNGCKDTTEFKIKVFDMDVRIAADDSSICLPATVQFEDRSVSDTTIVTWHWRFGEVGAVPSSQTNPSHSYTVRPTPPTPEFPEPGYPVILTLTDAIGCVESDTFTLKHYVPYSSITLSKPGLCLGDTLAIEAADFTEQGSFLTYDWNFGNSTTSTQKADSVYYAAEGIYPIRLVFTEDGSGCQGTLDASMSVQDYPQAYFRTNVDSLNVLCAPQNVFFRDSSVSPYPLTYTWDFGNGQSAATANYVLFYPKGNFTAQLVSSTSNGCTDTTSKLFNVYSPEGSFSINRNTICLNDSIEFQIIDTADVASYTWAFGDGNVLDDLSPVQHTYSFRPPSGIAPSRLVVRGVDGICPIEMQKNITIIQAIADFRRGTGGIDTTICFSDGAYQFTNLSSGYDQYTWNFGDGTTSSTAQNPAHQYPAPGIYDATLSILNSQQGCVDTITYKAVVFPNPKVLAVGDTACQGDPLYPHVLNPLASSQYVWSPATGLSNVNVPNPVSTVTVNFGYTVTEIDSNGCTDRMPVQVWVMEPFAWQDFDTTIIMGEYATLPLYNRRHYIFKWTPEDGLSCVNCDWPRAQPVEDTEYILTVSDSLNCFVRDYYYNIKVNPETFIRMPTMFTPNGDGNNDVVHVRGWGIKTLKEFKIYNRWGQLIFSSTDLQEGWDGTFKGVLQNNDVYAYKVVVETWRDTELFEEGFINLVR